MQTDLLQVGALRDSGVSRLLVCDDARPKVSTNTVDFAVSEIDEAAAGLTAFATARGNAKPLTADSWADLLIPFFLYRSPPKDRAMATVRGVMIHDPKTYDFNTVAEFIVAQHRSRTSV